MTPNPPAPGIPEPPPRPVRWRAAMARWWPFGLGVGSILVLLTAYGLWLWSASGGGLPFDDRTLDGVTELADAQVMAVMPTDLELNGVPVEAVRYTFDLGDGKHRHGVSYAPLNRFRPGQTAELEYLADDPDVHRLRGARRSSSSYWLPWFLGWLWLPALLLLVYWLRAVFKLRAVLRDGPTAVAEVLSARKAFGLNPPHLRVRYAFVDRFGDRHESGHWVRKGSDLGRAVTKGAAVGDAVTVTVVYREVNPKQSRLVNATDFG